MTETRRVTVGDRQMAKAVEEGWIKSFSHDGRWYHVVATQKLQRAFKATYGYSFGREAQVGTSGDFWTTIEEMIR